MRANERSEGPSDPLKTRLSLTRNVPSVLKKYAPFFFLLRMEEGFSEASFHRDDMKMKETLYRVCTRESTSSNTIVLPRQYENERSCMRATPQPNMSVDPSVRHKTVFRGFPLLPTRPRLMLPCIRPCFLSNTVQSHSNGFQETNKLDILKMEFC